MTVVARKQVNGVAVKHVAALLFTILDFFNLNIQDVSEELICTEVEFLL